MVRKRNQRSESLTRDEVLRVALAKVDAEGLEALTMRALARDLNVEAASLYNHVAGKDDLLDGVLRLMRSEMQLAEAWSADWKDQLGEVLLEYYRVLAAHPNMMPLAGRRLDDDQSGLVYLIEEQGFSTEDAVELFQSLVGLVVGFATFGSLYAEFDSHGLPDAMGERVADWRETTVKRSLRVLMEGYEET